MCTQFYLKFIFKHLLVLCHIILINLKFIKLYNFSDIKSILTHLHHCKLEAWAFDWTHRKPN